MTEKYGQGPKYELQLDAQEQSLMEELASFQGVSVQDLLQELVHEALEHRSQNMDELVAELFQSRKKVN